MKEQFKPSLNKLNQDLVKDLSETQASELKGGSVVIFHFVVKQKSTSSLAGRLGIGG